MMPKPIVVKKGRQGTTKVGLVNDAYHIVTENIKGKLLPLKIIEKNIQRFLRFMSICDSSNKDLFFIITFIGCEKEEYSIEEIAPLFKLAIYFKNVQLPKKFLQILSDTPLNPVSKKEGILFRNTQFFKYRQQGHTFQWIADKFNVDIATVFRAVKENSL